MTSAPAKNIWPKSNAWKAGRRPAGCTTIASKSRQYRYKRAERGARRGGRPYKKRQEIRRQPLGPGEAVFGERQGTNAFSGDAKDRVAHGGEDWREDGLFHARRWNVRVYEKCVGFSRETCLSTP